jgi:hypothetical protein
LPDGREKCTSLIASLIHSEQNLQKASTEFFTHASSNAEPEVTSPGATTLSIISQIVGELEDGDNKS